ncbi:MAG TPA: DMT family transporter [Planctomycetota bacterium]|nr:DMT family transporter [Planctomycetota bacterium]
MATAGQDLEERRRGERRGKLALVFVQLFFGLFPLFGKLAMAGFAPMSVAAWRVLVGAGALALVATLAHGRRMLVPWRDLLLLQLCAWLGVVLNMVLFLEGLQRSTAVNAGLLVATIPVFTFGIAIVARQERFDLRRGAGIALASAGVALLFLQRGPDFTPDTLLGNAMMALNALCYSLFLVLSRPLLARHPPLVVIAWVFVLSTTAVPFFLRDAVLVPAGLDTRAWASLAYVLVFPTFLSYLLNTYALSKVSASTTAVFIFLQPIIAVSSGVLVLGERLLPITLVSAATILAGVWLVARRRAPARVATPGISR